MSKEKARKHHYISQGYMRGFSDVKNQLYVKDKKNNSIRPTSPKGVAYLKDYYMVDTVDEKDSAEIEETLATIESVCIPILKKLASGSDLTNPEWADLAIYIGLQNGRTPFAKARMENVATIVATNLVKQKLADAYNNPAIFKEIADDFEKAHPEIPRLTKEKIKEWILKPGPLANLKMDTGNYVTQFFQNAHHIADGLLGLKWEVYHAPEESSFISSDNPIVIEIKRELAPNEVLAIMLKGSVRYFPINSKTCLVMSEGRDGRKILHTKISKKKVRKINKLIYNQAKRYVISGNENLISSL
jgi:hypothetical protein